MRAQQTATDGDGHADGWCLLPKATWGGWGRGEGDVVGDHVVGVGRRRYSGPCGVARSRWWPVGLVKCGPWRSADLAALCLVRCATCQNSDSYAKFQNRTAYRKNPGSNENSSVENQREQKNVNTRKKNVWASQHRRPAKLSINVYFSDRKAFFCTQASLLSSENRFC